MDIPTFEMRFAGPLSDVIARTREAVARVDPALTLFRIRTLERQTEDSFARERLLAAARVVFRRVRGAARVHRPVWVDELRGDPAHAGDWPADGARRLTGIGQLAGRARERVDRRPRRARRRGRRLRGRADRREPVVRHPASRSAGLRRRRRLTCSRWPWPPRSSPPAALPASIRSSRCDTNRSASTAGAAFRLCRSRGTSEPAAPAVGRI